MSVMRVRNRNGEGGFSLVEVLAALFVFTLLTLGLIPLLTSSIRGANTARADTIGKNAALKAMERVRGLPYHISYATSTDRVDVLDLYYPNASGDITVGASTLYRTTCPAAGAPVCPVDIPDGYTIQFDAQFVDPVATGTQPTSGETATSYANVPPAATYQWNSNTNDTPPRQILQMAITASWTVGGSPESYTITSLLSDREFGERKAKGTATLGYGIDIYTGYDSNDRGGTNLSSGNVFIPTSETDIEARRLSTARQSTTALRGELQRDSGGSLATAVGATSNVLQAPPDQNPGTVTAAAGQMNHPDFGNARVLNFGPSSVISPTAAASSAAPSGVGDASITGVIPTTTDYIAVRDPQLVTQDTIQLHLESGAPILRIVRVDGLPGALPGITAPVYGTNDVVVGGTRASTLSSSVHAQATTGFDRIYLLKADNTASGGWSELADTEDVYVGNTRVGTLTAFGHLVVIDDFRASVTCDSNSDGTGTGTARYSGTLYYWEDPQQNGNRNDGRYQRLTFDVSSTSVGADPLIAVMEQNFAGGEFNGPLVYDATSAQQRIYLFGKTLGGSGTGGGGSGQRLAYLKNWRSMTTTATRTDISPDAAGSNVASVNSTIEGAIDIETADLDVDRQNSSAMSISLGSLSCFAEDSR